MIISSGSTYSWHSIEQSLSWWNHFWCSANLKDYHKVALEHCNDGQQKTLPLWKNDWLPPLYWYKVNFNTTIRDSFLAQVTVCWIRPYHLNDISNKLSLPAKFLWRFGNPPRWSLATYISILDGSSLKVTPRLLFWLFNIPAYLKIGEFLPLSMIFLTISQHLSLENLKRLTEV